MRILYLDCFSGISGDMFLGALVALGCPISILEGALKRLSLPPFRIDATQVVREGISAVNLSFGFERVEETPRTYKEIRRMLEEADLKNEVRIGALEVFEALAEAESRVHGIDKEKVHFHEVGGLDTICDVVGAAVARDHLSIERLYVSPVPYGEGEIRCAHGILPNPAPATLELLKGFKTIKVPYAFEFVTPTGAAILNAWVTPEGSVPAYRLLDVGYGAGDREIPGRSNVLRAFLGETETPHPTDQVVLLETDIDDETPEVLADMVGRLFEEGALDVTAHPIMMKKGRVGTRITVVSPPERQDRMAAFLLRETSTLGVRLTSVTRRILEREQVTLTTPLGEARVKVAILPSGERKIAPEYASCAALARAHHLPLRRVMDLVKREAETLLASGSKKPII